jgi:glycosyltransferase involved in cell wall biosynthesis
MHLANSSWAINKCSGRHARDRMKILHVIDSGGLYGAEAVVLALMREQLSLGLAPVLVSIGLPGTVENPLEQQVRQQGLPVAAFRMRPGPNVAGAFEMIRYAQSVGADLFHSHGYKGNILLGLMPFRVRKIPVISTIHGWTSTGGLTRLKLYEWLDRLSFHFIDRVVLVSEAMKKHPRLQRRRLRFDVVENGISPTHGPSPAQSRLNSTVVGFCSGHTVVGAIGRLSEEKGWAFLLDAAAGLAEEFHNIRFVVIGEGHLRSALERKTAALGLAGSVLFTGYLPQARDYLPFFSLLAIPSLTEGLPIVLLEAMHAGVPIVASDVGGMPAALEYGRAGRLVARGNSLALKIAIRESIIDQSGTEDRVARARQRVAALYSSRIMAEKYLAIYQEIVRQGGTG